MATEYGGGNISYEEEERKMLAQADHDAVNEDGNIWQNTERVQISIVGCSVDCNCIV